jgi:multidrug efflux pump
MSSFFIDRPIFAAVIALFICLGGALALPFLPIAQYPIIAPPSISISTIRVHRLKTSTTASPA